MMVGPTWFNMRCCVVGDVELIEIEGPILRLEMQGAIFSFQADQSRVFRGVCEHLLFMAELVQVR